MYMIPFRVWAKLLSKYLYAKIQTVLLNLNHDHEYINIHVENDTALWNIRGSRSYNWTHLISNDAYSFVLSNEFSFFLGGIKALSLFRSKGPNKIFIMRPLNSPSSFFCSKSNFKLNLFGMNHFCLHKRTR